MKGNKVAVADPLSLDEARKQVEIDAAWAQHIAAETPTGELRRDWLLQHLKSQNYRCAYCHVPIHARP
jgi:hypothetical protein